MTHLGLFHPQLQESVIQDLVHNSRTISRETSRLPSRGAKSLPPRGTNLGLSRGTLQLQESVIQYLVHSSKSILKGAQLINLLIISQFWELVNRSLLQKIKGLTTEKQDQSPCEE
jgi:hypothetical protein